MINEENKYLDNNQQLVEKPKPKLLKFSIILLIAILLLGGVVLVLESRNKSNTSKESLAPTPFLPPADPRIKVDLQPLDRGKTVLLTISNYPEDVYLIEYELTYKSDKKQEGVFGTIKLQPGETSITREITLGTCSSGRCVYHNLTDNKGLLTIKFNAKSGASRFQKEFALL